MKPAGGLKLQLQTTARDDRRVRFAEVAVEPAGWRELGAGDERITLVTDSDGRLRYRLDPGRYRLGGEAVPDTTFTVRDRGWTPVRVRLS